MKPSRATCTPKRKPEKTVALQSFGIVTTQNDRRLRTQLAEVEDCNQPQAVRIKHKDPTFIVEASV
jgi:hypothetical protein